MLPPVARQISTTVRLKDCYLRRQERRWASRGAPPWRPAAILDEWAQQHSSLLNRLTYCLLKMGAARSQTHQSASIDLLRPHFD